MSGVLNPNISIFTAEAYTILSAVKHIGQTNLNKAVILTDSLSVVRALMSFQRHKKSVFNELYILLCSEYMRNQSIVLCGIPGHRSIKCNGAAEENATLVPFSEADINKPIPATDLKPFLRHKLRKYWQAQWDIGSIEQATHYEAKTRELDI